ncbi:uncharacterized protein RCO7_10829 [Rhynchosporium graminicola]|uniref:Uncharacterized protein n=1 Tax=Rhynchosporium graminicola TaxID=2792576 RepID=A0A1E1LT05_9HELO|nr:uncharacterized protein RCO7_10829 [Rhynchosporium commune]
MTSSRRAHHDRPSSSETSPLGTTTCSKGHVHPPWSTTGVLRIAKCESVCGFCQKETKTAANLRKHVAIHIKNEGLKLSIAEGSSGRGRLEMPTTAPLDHRPSRSTSSYFSSQTDDSDSNSMDTDPTSMSSYKRSFNPPPNSSSNQNPQQQQQDFFSPSAVLMSMASKPHASYPPYNMSASTSPFQGYNTHGQTYSHSPSPSLTPQPYPSTSSYPSSSTNTPSHHTQLSQNSPHRPSSTSASSDPFRALREHRITTKQAWTAIPSSEGFRILDLCKSLSVTQNNENHIPCYNRETIFDEEWQAHMKDVHGVFLLWPETWMRRVEVLDLDAFGGDIGVCNEVIMDS